MASKRLPFPAFRRIVLAAALAVAMAVAAPVVMAADDAGAAASDSAAAQVMLTDAPEAQILQVLDKWAGQMHPGQLQNLKAKLTQGNLVAFVHQVQRFAGTRIPAEAAEELLSLLADVDLGDWTCPLGNPGPVNGGRAWPGGTGSGGGAGAAAAGGDDADDPADGWFRPGNGWGRNRMGRGGMCDLWNP